MERYDYMQQMVEDIKGHIRDNFSRDEISENLQNRRWWENRLHDDLWIEDSVTGNASGSYTCNAWKAEEYIAHNWDLLGEAMEEFGCDCDIIKEGAEWCDVTIRCYLLGQAIAFALDELAIEMVD